MAKVFFFLLGDTLGKKEREREREGEKLFISESVVIGVGGGEEGGENTVNPFTNEVIIIKHIQYTSTVHTDGSNRH